MRYICKQKRLRVCESATPNCQAVHAQNRNVAKDRLERLVQNVAHLVLEVLRRDERVEQILPKHPLERDNLPTRSANRRVDVERFPEMVD